jgi:hypothetical protein
MRAIKGLKIDMDGGAGEVELPVSFMAESPLFRADVLGDWVGSMQTLYQDAVTDMYAGYLGISRENYLRNQEKENKKVLADSEAMLGSFSGRTIKEATMLEDGAVLLVFTDGTAHAIHQGEMSKAAPVLVSENLSEALAKESVQPRV